MTRFVIVCEEHTTPPIKTREQAETLLARITANGNCQSAHRIVEAAYASGRFAITDGQLETIRAARRGKRTD